MYGHHSFQMARLFKTTVHTNVEAIAIMLATGLFGSSMLHGVFIVASFAVGTGLHLLAHWAVAIAFGKNIDAMVLTRAGRIDYAGTEPGLLENVLRTAAGPTTNLACALVGWAVLHHVDTTSWAPTLLLAVQTATTCSWILTLVNFCPAVPLDGGLLLRAVLSALVPPNTARRAAIVVSWTLMAVVAAYGVWVSQPVLIYLAVVMSYDNYMTEWRGLRSG